MFIIVENKKTRIYQKIYKFQQKNYDLSEIKQIPMEKQRFIRNPTYKLLWNSLDLSDNIQIHKEKLRFPRTPTLETHYTLTCPLAKGTLVEAQQQTASQLSQLSQISELTERE